MREAAGIAVDHSELESMCPISKGGRYSQLLMWESKLVWPNFCKKLKIQNVYVKFLLFYNVVLHSNLKHGEGH